MWGRHHSEGCVCLVCAHALERAPGAETGCHVPVCDWFQVRLCVVISEGHDQGWTVPKMIAFIYPLCLAHPTRPRAGQEGRGGLAPLWG